MSFASHLPKILAVAIGRKLGEFECLQVFARPVLLGTYLKANSLKIEVNFINLEKWFTRFIKH